MLEARAFWVTAPGHGEIRAQQLRSPGPGEVLIRTLRSAISRGSESLVFRGEVPQSEWRRMRCPFQEGEFPAPVKYGYSAVGIVEDGPAEALGRRVFCLHPHQDRFIVPREAVVDVPDAVPDRRATLAANMETAINGMWDAMPGPGDRIAVIGAGVVGCLVAALAARLPGAEIELIDIDPSPGTFAAALGCHFATPEKASPEADLVVHASGSPAGLVTALTIAGFEATVLELSWYGTRIVPLELGGAFHSRRLTLRASQVGAVPAVRRQRWPLRRRLTLALSLLRDPVFDVLLSGETEFAALPALMPRLATSSAGILCHTLRYD
ncbi:MAG: zinc-binding alcohol dehydrogenase [Alphaproteobacteria bacterium]|nr:zinc-binding alcohol dehydrogenase [Alphaproteobacteria bacterium]